MSTTTTVPRNPEPAYRGSPAIYGDKELYARLGRIVDEFQEKEFKDAGSKGLWSGAVTLESIEKFLIPIRSGKAWVVKKGQICTLSTPQGPQVGDLNIFSLNNPREHFWASRTKQLHAAHVSVGDRLWSNLPYMRPLCTIVADSLKAYGADEVGGRCHDLLGTRCDPYINKLLSGDDFDFQCHSSLTRAVLPWGLTEHDVHDVINVFQVTGLNQDDKYFMEPSPATPTSYFSFFAETDILCAMATCPGGDLSVFGWGEDSAKRMLDTCRPLGVAVYEITGAGGLKEEVLKGWKESERPGYRGMHGLRVPVFGQQ